MDEDTTTPSAATHDEERAEETAKHDADRQPTPEEERSADDAAADPELSGDAERVREHYREMTDRGVAEKGEGRIP